MAQFCDSELDLVFKGVLKGARHFRKPVCGLGKFGARPIILPIRQQRCNPPIAPDVCVLGRIMWGFGRFQANSRGPVIKFDPAVFRSIQIEDALKKFVRPWFS